jgi:hypothetical protein
MYFDYRSRKYNRSRTIALFFQKKKNRPAIIYAEETCLNCNGRLKRLFEDGDYVYKPGLKCKLCSGHATISTIYAEYPPGKKNTEKF